MHLGKTIATRLLIPALFLMPTACDGRDSRRSDAGTPRDGGVSEDGGDLADGGTPTGDGGSASDFGTCSARAATTGDSGERTAFPGIRISSTTPELRIESVNYVFVPAEDGLQSVLFVYLDVENVSASNLCAGQYRVGLGTFDGVASLVGPTHSIPPAGNTIPCVAPGGRGVIRALLRGATEDVLRTASELRVDADRAPTSGLGESPIEVPALTNTRIEAQDGSWVLRQTVTSSGSVRNYFQNAFAIDSRGLVIARIEVPGGGPDEPGATLQAGVSQELVSSAVPCEFTDFFIASHEYLAP